MFFSGKKNVSGEVAGPVEIGLIVCSISPIHKEGIAGLWIFGREP
jgi:hypothetical protein